MPSPSITIRESAPKSPDSRRDTFYKQLCEGISKAILDVLTSYGSVYSPITPKQPDWPREERQGAVGAMLATWERSIEGHLLPPYLPLCLAQGDADNTARLCRNGLALPEKQVVDLLGLAGQFSCASPSLMFLAKYVFRLSVKRNPVLVLEDVTTLDGRLFMQGVCVHPSIVVQLTELLKVHSGARGKLVLLVPRAEVARFVYQDDRVSNPACVSPSLRTTFQLASTAGGATAFDVPAARRCCAHVLSRVQKGHSLETKSSGLTSAFTAKVLLDMALKTRHQDLLLWVVESWPRTLLVGAELAGAICHALGVMDPGFQGMLVETIQRLPPASQPHLLDQTVHIMVKKATENPGNRVIQEQMELFVVLRNRVAIPAPKDDCTLAVSREKPQELEGTVLEEHADEAVSDGGVGDWERVLIGGEGGS